MESDAAYRPQSVRRVVEDRMNLPTVRMSGEEGIKEPAPQQGLPARDCLERSAGLPDEGRSMSRVTPPLPQQPQESGSMYQTELAWNGGPVTNRTDLAEDAMPREAWSATKCC